jgi:adenylosuccinate synthase
VVESAVDQKNRLLKALGLSSGPEPRAVWERIEPHLPRLRECVTDTVVYLNEEIKRGRKVLMEAAQGTLLDIDHGTYPYCTSSNTTAGGICTGLGIPPKAVEYVAGVAKAYTTRVGEGPFPTELHGEAGVRLREEGVEFGATTGRPRRCGWFDAMLVRHAILVNGLDGLIVTKLDVLDGLAQIPVCTGYELNGRKITGLPASAEDLAAVRPVYEELAGWKSDTSKARSWKDLPAGARKYLDFIADASGAPVIMVSVGSARDAVVWVKQNLLQ